MQNSYITLPDSQKILRRDSRIVALVEALSKTLKAWNTDLVAAQIVLDAAARAMNFNRYWYYYSNISLDEDPGTVFRNEQNQRYFTFDERIILRFKLIDRNFKSKNYPTRKANQWRLQIPLQGMLPCERLEFSYRLDLTGTVIQDAFILLRVGSSIVWLWQIWGPRIDTFPVQLALAPLEQAQPTVFAYDNYQ